jgi:hypothetical protein
VSKIWVEKECNSRSWGMFLCSLVLLEYIAKIKNGGDKIFC